MLVTSITHLTTGIFTFWNIACITGTGFALKALTHHKWFFKYPLHLTNIFKTGMEFYCSTLKCHYINIHYYTISFYKSIWYFGRGWTLESHYTDITYIATLLSLIYISWRIIHVCGMWCLVKVAILKYTTSLYRKIHADCKDKVSPVP
jgi:hypothetical protein